MGWEIHITGAEHWADSDQHPITAQEWLSFVGADSELTIDPRDNGPYCALWLARRIEGAHPWVGWVEGTICTKNPDRETLGKALQIARHFGARVQGDDGEEYKRPEDLG